MDRNYDLVVVGTGVAGASIAKRCASAGLAVAIVDRRPFGGTCALRGCDPKKVLRSAAEVVDAFRRLEGRGVVGTDVGVNWERLMAFKRTFTDPVPEARAKGFADAGIDAVHGVARFEGPDRMMVGDVVLKAARFVIAAGSKPADLPVEGSDLLAISDDFLALDRLPARLVLVGGGYIAVEFAHIAARAGVHVTMIERGDRLLKPFDSDLVSVLADRMAGLGIDIRTDAAVRTIERHGKGYRVHAAGAVPFAIDADLVVHAAGRVPDLADLDLAAAGVVADKAGIVVDDFLRSTTADHVFAAGDAAAHGLPLTPAASHDAEVVSANLIEGPVRRVNYAGMPSVVFSIPPLATVGLNEQDAHERGPDFRTVFADTAGWYSARRVGETAAAHKILIARDDGRILGAHLLGPHADEMINLFALAVRHGLTADAMRGTIFGYPTGASDLSSML